MLLFLMMRLAPEEQIAEAAELNFWKARLAVFDKHLQVIYKLIQQKNSCLTPSKKKSILIKATFFLRISCWTWFFSLRPSVQAHSMSQTQATKWQFCSLRVWCVRVWSTHTRTANTKIIQLACNLESECIWSDLMRNFVLFSGATIWFSENWMRIWEMHRMAF